MNEYMEEVLSIEELADFQDTLLKGSGEDDFERINPKARICETPAFCAVAYASRLIKNARYLWPSVDGNYLEICTLDMLDTPINRGHFMYLFNCGVRLFIDGETVLFRLYLEGGDPYAVFYGDGDGDQDYMASKVDSMVESGKYFNYKSIRQEGAIDAYQERANKLSNE